jgi:hypothetical protein
MQEEDSKLALMINSFETLIFLGECWKELYGPSEQVVEVPAELPSFDWTLDPDDFAADCSAAYDYKTEYCLFEVGLLGIDGWAAVILEREGVLFNPHFGAGLQLWLMNSRLRLFFSVIRFKVLWCRHRVKLRWVLCDTQLCCDTLFSAAYCEWRDKFRLTFRPSRVFNLVLKWIVRKLKPELVGSGV